MHVLSALLVTLASVSALTPGLHASSVRLRRQPACLTRLRCSSVDAAADDSESFSAYDISSELAKYNKPGLRLRQSGPMRLVSVVIDFARDKANGVARWLSRAAATPWIRIMVMLMLAYQLQNPMSGLGIPVPARRLMRLLMMVTIIVKLKSRGR